MNNLSWAFYFTDLFAGIGVCAAMICTLSGIATIILTIAYLANSSDNGYGAERQIQESALRVLKFTIPLFIIFVFIAIATPSRETMRMIVVSEFGERLYNSKDAQEIIDPAKELLKKYIKDQLEKKNEKSLRELNY